MFTIVLIINLSVIFYNLLIVKDKCDFRASEHTGRLLLGKKGSKISEQMTIQGYNSSSQKIALC